MSDRPKSNTSLSEAYEAEIDKIKAAELARSQTILFNGVIDANNLVQPEQPTVDAIFEYYADFREEQRKTITQILGADDNELGTVADLVALTRQGDFMDTRRRAQALRYASRPRRMVHSAMRRKSHAGDNEKVSGYYEKRLRSLLVELLQAAKEESA